MEAKLKIEHTPSPHELDHRDTNCANTPVTKFDTFGDTLYEQWRVRGQLERRVSFQDYCHMRGYGINTKDALAHNLKDPTRIRIGTEIKVKCSEMSSQTVDISQPKQAELSMERRVQLQEELHTIQCELAIWPRSVYDPSRRIKETSAQQLEERAFHLQRTLSGEMSVSKLDELSGPGKQQLKITNWLVSHGATVKQSKPLMPTVGLDLRSMEVKYQPVINSNNVVSNKAALGYSFVQAKGEVSLANTYASGALGLAVGPLFGGVEINNKQGLVGVISATYRNATTGETEVKKTFDW